MRPLTVLHVIESMTRGGAETVVLEHLRHAGPGTRSIVCALNRGGPALDEAARLGARAVLLGKEGRRLDGVRRLVALARAERATVINGHNPVGALYGTLAGTLAAVPAIVRTEHSIHYPGRHSRVYAGLLEPLLTWRTGGVVCVCEAVRASHVRRLGWAARRFVTIDNGVSDDPPARAREAVRAELGIFAGTPLVLAVGSLTPQKAQDVLVDAFARVAGAHPAARLAIAGAGPLEPELRARIAAAGLGERVALLGPRTDVADLMGACDLFVLSSVREGLAITLLEAMRAGRPAVVTDIGGNAAVVDPGVTGLVVPTRDAAALAAAIDRVLALPGFGAAWGAAARHRFERRYRAERMVRETEALYRQLLGEPVPALVPAAVDAPSPASRRAATPPTPQTPQTPTNDETAHARAPRRDAVRG